ncbi:MAG: hypothetical protein A2Z99_08300 [Treponema sp. GWB1_62_6]|nr:MAG: hypothetical protein A2Z99_08300 [Treponema sp. GWB1_62_6]
MVWTAHIDRTRGLPSRLEGHAIVRRQLEEIAALGGCPLRVLDCCVGMGEFLESLEGDERFCCYGVDLDPALVDIARTHAPTAEIEVGDALALPFADAAIDVAVATGLIEHVESPVGLLREMRRVAGWALIMTPNLLRPRRFWRAARRQLQGEPEGHLQGYDRHLLVQVLANQGWEVWEVDVRFVDAPWGIRWLSYGPLRRAFPWLGSEMYAMCRGRGEDL